MPPGVRAYIRSIFTAWEIPNNRVIQVLTWRHYQYPSLLQISASLELRYGAQICTISELVETPIAVCFGDVRGDKSSAVKILSPDALYIYEPFIPTEPAGVKETGCWKHPDLVSVAYEASYAGPQEKPRLRVLSLEKLAATCLLSCRLKQLFAHNRTPEFENHYAAFIPTHRPVRTKPGSIQPRAITVLAFGATELVSKMYHIFLFSLSLPCPTFSTSHPRITVVKAKALTSNDTFSWSTMEKSSAYELFRRALTQLGINTRRVPESGHDCEEDCWGGGDDVCVLKRYLGGELQAEESLKRLLLKENGIVLEGWGKEV